MKTGINKSAKKVLSMVIAFSLLLGTLFVANAGVGLTADAATDDVGEKRIEYWDGSSDNSLTGSGTQANPYIITNAAELNYVCTVAGDAATVGKYYKVDPAIKAFVLQTSATVTALGGDAAFINISSAEQTKALFETTAAQAGVTLVNWVKNGNNIFDGNFDGSGVTIYGLYSDGAALGRDNSGLFPGMDGGGAADQSVASDTTGITVKNFAVRNSYFKGYRRVGVITGTAWWSGGGRKVNGVINLDAVEVTDCFLVGQNLNESGSAIVSYNNGEMAVVGGAMANDPVKVTNAFICGNETEFRTYASATATEYTLNESLSFDRMFAQNGKNPDGNVYGSVHNSVVLGTLVNVFWNNNGAEFSGNVYSDASKVNALNITYLSSAEQVKGSAGKSLMSGLTWATAETAGNGTAQWYAVEGDYPTVIMPEGWQDNTVAYPVFSGSAAVSFESGTGTQADPYIIKTPDQLYKMVTSSGKLSDDTTAYYKVADGVDKLYLNPLFGVETLAGVKALVASGTANYKNWDATTEFYGNFDGNGVTVIGMVSYNKSGFVKKMSGASVVRNVHFEACYAYSWSYAAIVTTSLGTWNTAAGVQENRPTISKISVRNSYIKSDRNATLTARTTTNSAYKLTDGGNVYVAGSETSTAGTYYVVAQESGNIVYDIIYATAAGIVSTSDTPKQLIITNCLFDGYTSELVQGSGSTVDNRAGIMSALSQANNVSINNCVSLGAPVIPEAVGPNGEEIFYNRYNSQWITFSVSNCYSDMALRSTNLSGTAVSTYWDKYFKTRDNVTRVAKKDVYERNDFEYLDWVNAWGITDVGNGRAIPVPHISTVKITPLGYTSFTEMLSNHNNAGLISGRYPQNSGNFGWYLELTGSGTEADPYIIDTAEKLAIAIATGGKDLNSKLYYKLACDINLGIQPWIDCEVSNNKYSYTEFAGTLDGDGHTVSGLSSVNQTAAGLIPVLNGGTVKNLHIRDSYAGSKGSAGVIAGIVKGSSTIEGCSIENGYSTGTTLSVGSGSATIKNSYSVSIDGDTTYYINGVIGTPTDFYSAANPNGVWYKGIEGTPRLVSYARAHTIADIDGDGVIGDNYTTNDVVALRNYLLGVDGYANIYGDVSGNGATNISDLAIIRREMVGDYESVKDGFWRNVELGKVKIYYAENDTQDMARKLELYLESIYPQVDIVKVAGTAVTDASITSGKANYANEDNAIVITKAAPTAGTYTNYSVNYNAAKNVLTVNGNSFTAVEQAVLDFIANNKPETGANPANITGAIGANKAAKTVNGVTYYYAWGDEFDDAAGTGTFSTNTWNVREYKGEGKSLNGLAPTDSATGDTRYLNTENPNVDNLKDLWVVKDGKLSIWRGINTDVYTGSEDYSWGYKGVAAGAAGTTNDLNCLIDSDDIYVDPGLITTDRSMMFKQGYAEMRASLPSDGHAFPAWWFVTGANIRNNYSMNSILYNKIYTLNGTYDGTTNAMDPTNLTTYKYQVPKAYLEFDIVEFMQGQSEKNGSNNGVTTGNWRDYMNLTIHKYYNQNTKGDNLYIPDWSTGTSGTAISRSTFNSTAAGSFIHRYNPDNTTSPYAYSYKTGALWWEKEVETAASYSVGKAIDGGKLASGKAVTDYYTYGFSWTVDKANKSYDLYVYVDFNDDGTMAADEMVFHLDETNGHESKFNGDGLGERTLTDYTHGTDDEYDVWNQYAYMLLDNSFYSSNPWGTGSSGTGVTMFTDLLSKETGHGSAGAADKTTFDIEYVRVYQQNGRRDLVTAETEAFNTTNHFGY